MAPAVRFAAAALAAAAAAAAPACPCANAAWCAPIATPAGSRSELLAFHEMTANASVWAQYDWSRITTLAAFALPHPGQPTVDADLVCRAHAAGARVVVGASITQGELANATLTTAWIDRMLPYVVDAVPALDGFNLDIEGDKGGAANLTAFVKQLSGALRAACPSCQLSFDSSIYPTAPGVEAAYDLKALAQYCDFLVPMAYDMCWYPGDSVAGANSPYDRFTAGIAAYTQALGIPGHKVVAGLPWYGYLWQCDGSADAEAGAEPAAAPAASLAAAARTGLAPLKPAPKCALSAMAPSFRFSQIVALPGGLLAAHNASVAYDPVSLSPWAEWTDAATGQRSQLWFDDEGSLQAKAQAAATGGLLGVAMWAAPFLDYAGGQRVASMWQALEAPFQTG